MKFLGFSIIFSLLIAVEGRCAAAKPNVLLVLTDDQGWGDVHSHGNDRIDTPVMDRMAAEGARFVRFFVSPVCSPTRASLLTGRYHLRTGTHDVTRAGETMRADEVTMAEVFKANGYATGCFGKWHNGAHHPNDPNGQGFDEFLGFCAGHWNNYFDTTLQHNRTMVRTQGYMIDVLADAVLAFMERNQKRPFFCYVPFNIPHSPFQVADKYFNKYKERGFDDTQACVYGMCENIDHHLGRFLKQLDDLGIAENTIVIFLSDNGANTSRYNGDMRGRKGSHHEGGSRVPFFIRWPGHIKAATTVKPIAMHIDILPTLVEMCGLSQPGTKPLDGMSLVPLLESRVNDWPDRMLFTHWGGRLDRPNRGAVRTQRWRAVLEGNGWQLYDMQADAGETKDIAGDQPDLTRRFSDAFEAWWKDVTKSGFDPIPVCIGHPEVKEVTLPGHEAFLHPEKGRGIGYNGRAGWANDWIDHWTSTGSYPWWPIDVVEAGQYEITLMYACAEADVGSRVRVEIGGQGIEGTITKAHDPEPIHSPDRVKRMEVYEKTWASLELGALELPKGLTKLAVKAVTKGGAEVVDLKAIPIKRVN